MLLAPNQRWNLQYRMITSSGIGDRTNSQVAARVFASKLTELSRGAVRLSQLGGNPSFQVVRVDGLLGTTQSNIRASVTVESNAVFDTSLADRAFAEAMKGAGNPGFSATRIAGKVPASGGCGIVDAWGVLQRGDVIFRVCRDQSVVSSGASSAPVPVSTIMDSVVSTSGTAVVQNSTNPAEIGTVVPTVGDRTRSGIPNAWAEIPIEYKIAAGAVIGVALFGLAAYTLRSVAIIKATT